MKIEKIKKDNKKNIVIGVFGVIVLISTIVYVNTRAKYQTIDSIRLASGAVTFKAADFDLVDIYLETDVAHSTHEYNSKHYMSSNSIPTSGYTLDEDTSYCIVENSDGTINKENTHIGITDASDGITFSNVTKRGSKCYLYYDLKPITGSTLSQNPIKTLTTSAQFGVMEPRSGVTPAPGLYEFDGMTSGSKTQFYRGAVTNNYVRLGKDSSNYTYWRIVRFDEDGNIRLIYDGTSAHENGQASNDRVLTTNYDGTNTETRAYHSTHAEANVRWSNSPIRTYLEGEWLTSFESRLSNKEKLQLTTGKFCSDSSVASTNGNFRYYGAYGRLDTKKEPSFDCATGDITIAKVGVLSADEYSFAGGGGNGSTQTNTSFYLYTGNPWWTMTPYYWYSSGGSRSGTVFVVFEDGYLFGEIIHYTDGVRPVITLDKNTKFNPTTNGTKGNPYTIAN